MVSVVKLCQVLDVFYIFNINFFNFTLFFHVFNMNYLHLFLLLLLCLSTEAAIHMRYIKSFSEKFTQISRKTLRLESLFDKVAERPWAEVFSCEFCKYFQNSFFCRTPSGGCFCQQFSQCFLNIPIYPNVFLSVDILLISLNDMITQFSKFRRMKVAFTLFVK